MERFIIDVLGTWHIYKVVDTDYLTWYEVGTQQFETLADAREYAKTI